MTTCITQSLNLNLLGTNYVPCSWRDTGIRAVNKPDMVPGLVEFTV